MCGIIAYLGSGDTVSVLLEGLQRMEYRGYDSAGMAVVMRESGDLQTEKKVGKVKNLRNACAGRDFSGNADVGIAHTRWATHGQPSDVNAHPHSCSDGSLAIVHNGIIENYQSLKKKLTGLGYTFKSDTDTEVLAALIGHVRSLEPDLSLSAAVSLALTQVRGAYGIAVVEKSSPGLLVGARRGSPLILGVSDTSLVVASDATAVVGLTDKVVYLEEEDIVELRKELVDGQPQYKFHIASMKRDSLLVQGISTENRPSRVDSIYTSDEETTSGSRLDNSIRRSLLTSNKAISAKVVREMHELTMNLETIEKGGYDHFMLKEIMEQPKVLRDCMRGRLNKDTGDIKLGGLSQVMDRITAARRIIICACGTSYHSALVGEYLIESLAKIPVEVEYASEFRYRNPVLFPEDVVIVISQSGETADTLEAIRISRQNKCLSLGIVNVVGSSIARETDAGIYLHVGPEIGVASTKAFTGQVMALTMLALQLGRSSGQLNEETARDLGRQLYAIPDKIELMLVEKNLEKVQEMAATYRYAHNFLYLGRGYQFPVALEGALKLKEISYIHAEGYPAAEMKHGPIALIDQMMPVVVIAPKRDSTYEKVKSGIEEVVARKGSVIVITDEGNRDLDTLAEFVLETPVTNEYFSPMLSVIHLQLLSYYIAKMRGCEIDQPRNLAKSVTVE
eukprot:CAMPEP_0202082492 /NCGR_PEP_ID=MMETSP0964-20121228/19665_1 /ASSEMBLY_ACC=CAM_ASM_000500 /TAXON_ID=4773 /ORGANISM="Schizochytrium aggregatum, Strain ATCC28209" /LENGTH=677 /DNA_ID=CAMNT_0048650135 /DNA_START=49 /DNA_END=2082 /DNA_ORIENTATION=-